MSDEKEYHFKKGNKWEFTSENQPRKCTQYNEDRPQEVMDYFVKREFVQMCDSEVIESEDGMVVKKKARAVGTPTFAGYATSIGVSPRAIGRWKEKYPEFKEACEIAKEAQKEHIIANASSGIAPVGFAIFMLKNNHGMVDKVENQVSGGMKLESLIGQTISRDEFEKEKDEETDD